MKPDSSYSSMEYISDESSESETEKELKILKGFFKRAREDPELAELKKNLGFYEERNDTTLGFFFSFPVPKKKRSVIVSQAEKGTDSTKQDTPSFKWIRPVACDLGGTPYLSSLDKDEYKEEERKERRRKVNPMKMKVTVPRQPLLDVEVEPPMPERLKAIVEKKNGVNITFVMQKVLTSTDLAQQNNRLSLPRKQIKTHSFLTNEEDILDDAKTNNGFSVELITLCGNPVNLTFRKWRMNCTFVYNFIGAWFKQVVNDKNNRLEVGKIVRLWSFRSMSKLSFALDCD